MSNSSRAYASAYMEWVKTRSHVPFNLANSGVKSYPLSGLPVDLGSLALSGPGAYGYTPLIEAIAAKCGVDPDCVATAPGTSMANYLAMAATIEPGDEVVVEHPAYPLLVETAEFAGATVKHFERSAEMHFAIDMQTLERSISSKTRLIVLTNLHNPSCARIDEATLRQIGELAESNGTRVLVDEVYLDLLFDRAPETAFRLGKQFIVTSSLTKVYGLSGLRCGWALAEPDLVRRMYRIADLLYVNAPYVTDQLSSIAFAHLNEIAKWAQNLLKENLAIANDFVRATPQLDCPPLEIGTVLFPRVTVPVDQLCRLLREEYETVITPGHFFGSPDRVRIGIAGETSVLVEGLNRVHDALARLTET